MKSVSSDACRNNNLLTVSPVVGLPYIPPERVPRVPDPNHIRIKIIDVITRFQISGLFDSVLVAMQGLGSADTMLEKRPNDSPQSWDFGKFTSLPEQKRVTLRH